jgi:lysozyme family protein
MLNNFQPCLAFTLAWEGGYTTDQRDPGNWTGGAYGQGQLLGSNMGISAASYPTLDIPNLTLADVSPIYQSDYWSQIAGDVLGLGADLKVFDFAVNAGVTRSKKFLQAALDVVQDGQFGPRTLAAIQAADVPTLIERLAVAQSAFYRASPQYAVYGTGWDRRLVACTNAAYKMAGVSSAQKA